MPTRTSRTQKEDTHVEPRDNQMFERRGFDRRGLRRELANTTPIALDDIHIEYEDQEFVDPRTLDLAMGPTGMGETAGNGIETLTVDGERFKTVRYADGFEYLAEDATDPAQQRDAILELYDLLADANFFKGITDYRDDTQIKKGAIQWLKDNIPASRTFDAENYDNDSGDKDYTSNPENLIKYDAFKEVGGRILDNNDASWDLMVGRQSALANFNKISGAEGGVGGESYFQRLNDPDAIGGVNEMWLLPDDLQPAPTPQGEGLDDEALTIDLTTELGTDEVILLPDMDVVSDAYWSTYEMPEPEVFGPMQERGGKEAVDYIWRYAQDYDPDNTYANAEDAVHLKNVSVLFN